ncbi:ABC transporter permease [Candidatus Poriferisodalis sp.]|uniref:ABC transporter permease n=1 Tax=Candidatus Poriferisodalis sp. TaxID=3101277 RepID=UPI003B59C192
MGDFFTYSVILGIFVATLKIATPLLIAATGELVAESSGILNLSIEGTMTLGAFAGFVTANETGSLWLGLLGAAAGGGALALLMAIMTVTVRVNQVVAGLALNILGLGAAFFWYRSVYSAGGSIQIPVVDKFEVVSVPLLSSIPIVGEVLFEQHWLTYIALLMVPATWMFLNRTKYGLELRAIGHNPEACDMRGVPIASRQYAAVIFGGAMAGVGGSFLSLAATGLFFPDIVAGRGWIALAIVIFGNWRATWILAGSLLFGFLEATQLALQASDVNLPYQLLLALPFVLTILALVLNRSRSGAPLSLTIPYHRGER